MYELQLNREQLVLLQNALESYFRIRINQWGELADELAGVGFTYNNEDPENKEKFNAYIKRRDEAKQLFEQAMLAAQPQRRTDVMYTSEEVRIAQDIWQVIRHHLFMERGEIDDYCTARRTPIQMSSQPLPIIEKK